MRKTISAAVVAAMVAGCATTPEHYRQNKAGLSDLEVCRASRAAMNAADWSWHSETMEDMAARGLTAASCVELVAEAEQKAKTVGAIVLGVAALALIASQAKKGRIGGSQATGQDFDWDWDLFYGERMQMVWACRGVQTGQFAEPYRCQHKAQTDLRWPGLQAPWR